MTESLLLALMAAAAGFLISRVALAVIVNALMTSMPPDIGDVRLLVPDADWRVLLFLLAGAVVSTIAFALAPALQATRIEPIRTMRGEVVRDARPGRARNFLIGLQVSASALLLISAAVFLRSAFAGASHDTGVRTSDTVVVQIVNEQMRDALVQAVTAEPSVAAVAASWPELGQRPAFGETGRVKTRSSHTGSSRRSTFACWTLRSCGGARSRRPRTHPIFRWPSFPRRRRGRCGRMPIRSAKRYGSTRNRRSEPRRGDDAVALGAKEEPKLESQTFTVVGVVRDVAGLRIAPFEKAVVYVPTSPTMPRTSLIARVHGDPELARQTLLNRLTAIDPDMGRQVTTLRTLARMETFFLQVGFWLTVVLGGLALALTLSGLFSVLSYVVEQRTKEIGVRMTLGANDAGCHAADPVAVDPARRLRPVHRRRFSRRTGRVAADHTGRGRRWRDRSRPRSGRLRREPAHHHRGLPVGRLDSGHPRRTPRPDAGASPGLGHRLRGSPAIGASRMIAMYSHGTTRVGMDHRRVFCLSGWRGRRCA